MTIHYFPLACFTAKLCLYLWASRICSLNAESGMSDPLAFLLFKGAWSSLGLGLILLATLLLAAVVNYWSTSSQTYYKQGQVYAARIWNAAAQNAETFSPEQVQFALGF